VRTIVPVLRRLTAELEGETCYVEFEVGKDLEPGAWLLRSLQGTVQGDNPAAQQKAHVKDRIALAPFLHLGSPGERHHYPFSCATSRRKQCLLLEDGKKTAGCFAGGLVSDGAAGERSQKRRRVSLEGDATYIRRVLEAALHLSAVLDVMDSTMSRLSGTDRWNGVVGDLMAGKEVELTSQSECLKATCHYPQSWEFKVCMPLLAETLDISDHGQVREHIVGAGGQCLLRYEPGGMFTARLSADLGPPRMLLCLAQQVRLALISRGRSLI
jgi:hypothetical protein